MYHLRLLSFICAEVQFLNFVPETLRLLDVDGKTIVRQPYLLADVRCGGRNDERKESDLVYANTEQ